jgi:F-type H+-transporting ATPase subunit b
MPQLEQISTYASQVFWLVVTFVVLYLIMRYVAIPKITAVLEQRRDKMEGDLDRAAALKQEAEATLAEYEAAVASGRAKAQEVIRRTTEEMSEKATAEHQALGQRLADQIREAETRIDEARDAALADVQAMSADVAQTAVERLAGLKVDKRSADAAVKAAAEARS